MAPFVVVVGLGFQQGLHMVNFFLHFMYKISLYIRNEIGLLMLLLVVGLSQVSESRTFVEFLTIDYVCNC